MLYFPIDTNSKTIAIVMNPKLYDNKTFIKTKIMSRLFSLGVKDIAKQLVSVASFVRAEGKKPTKKMLEPHINELLEFADTKGITTLLTMDANYFTYLTKKKFEASIGNVCDCIIEGYEHIKVLPVVSPLILKTQPTKRAMFEQSFLTASESILGTYSNEEFKFETYRVINTAADAKEALEYISTFPKIAWDIEATGLHHIRNELVTQAFAVSETEAYTFVMHEKFIGKEEAERMHKVFKDFFKGLTFGNLIVHNMGFESKWLMSKYIMNSYDDYKSMYKYLEELEFEDTMLIAYALLNSTERVSLSLKDLAKHKYGDWDADINVKDILNQPIDKVCYYNAIDVSATFYLHNTLLPKLSEGQLKFYEGTMKDTQRSFTAIMCTGLPIDMSAVLSAKEELTERLEGLNETFHSNRYVLEATSDLHFTLAQKYNETHKVKQVTTEDFKDILFNPNSNKQLQDLIYTNLGFEVEELTKSGAPSTAKAVIEDFLKDASIDDDTKEVLECLKGFSEVSIILNTFLNSFEHDSVEVADGVFRLYGNLRNGGTQTYRPTASNPNLLNAPSGSTYGKLIKKCFKAPAGFIIGSSDYASLQGKTAGNLTGDKALIKIYTEDIDLHSYMLVRYWPEEFDKDRPETPEFYNWVKENYGKLRQKSKGITFACQFGSGPKKIAKMLGASYDEGFRIWKAYHETYSGISEFGETTLEFASEHGYVPLGLGLRLQTPTLAMKAKATVRKLRNDQEVDEDDRVLAEARLGGNERSAINARTQFWDVLTLIGLRKFILRVIEAGYEKDVIVHSTVYDSIYMEIHMNPQLIQWVNDNLIDCMCEDYLEDQPVKLSANLDIGGTWADIKEIPNGNAEGEIKAILETLSTL